MIFCVYLLNIWLNAYENLKSKEHKNHIFNFYNLLKMKESRQFPDKTVPRNSFWRQFPNRFEDNSPTPVSFLPAHPESRTHIFCFGTHILNLSESQDSQL